MLIQKIEEVKKEFNLELSAIENIEQLDILYNKFLSRKGLVANLFSIMGDLDPSDRPSAGNELNNLKEFISAQISSSKEKFSVETDSSSNIDYSIPGKSITAGSIHPLTKTISLIENIIQKIGFSIAYGPEVDTDFYNFEALNIPKHHPARDMQDTFYISDGNVLRTHTSNSQIHFMMENKPPIRIIAPGRVYRNEDVSVRS